MCLGPSGFTASATDAASHAMLVSVSLIASPYGCAPLALPSAHLAAGRRLLLIAPCWTLNWTTSECEMSSPPLRAQLAWVRLREGALHEVRSWELGCFIATITLALPPGSLELPSSLRCTCLGPLFARHPPTQKAALPTASRWRGEQGPCVQAFRTQTKRLFFAEHR